MPDTGCLFLSLTGLVVGSLVVLHPKGVLRLSGALNRTLAVVDDRVVRYRYVIGVLAFVASFAFFKLALMLPSLR